jgi:hypothetical protein
MQSSELSGRTAREMIAVFAAGLRPRFKATPFSQIHSASQ